jgi:hypothetical protein
MKETSEMRKILLRLALGAFVAVLPAALWADTLILRDGTRHEGDFISGTSRVITFKENGMVSRYGTESVDVLQFGPEDQGSSSGAPSGGFSADANGNYPSDRVSSDRAPSDRANDQQANDRNPAPRDDRDRNSARDNSDRNISDSDRPVIPAGTELVIRTSESINSRTARVDQTFAAQVDRDVVGDSGRVMIPRGSDARLVITRIDNGGATGTPELMLDVQSIRINGRSYLVDTTDLGQKGTSGIGKNKRTGEYVGGGAVLGTIIGAIAGGGKGAAIGAVGGAAAGAGAEVLTKGKEVHVPSETVLRFNLDNPVHLRYSE